MLADGIVAAGPIAYVRTVGVPIIPEVTKLGKELLFAVEIDLIEPSVAPPEPPIVIGNNVVDGPDNVIDGVDEVVD